MKCQSESIVNRLFFPSRGRQSNTCPGFRIQSLIISNPFPDILHLKSHIHLFNESIFNPFRRQLIRQNDFIQFDIVRFLNMFISSFP